MASYSELKLLMVQGGLSDRVLVALLDVAQDIAQESEAVENHDNRYRWAASVFRDPHSRVMAVLSGVLIAHKSVGVDEILAASDSTIKSAVAELVDLFAGVGE